MLLSALVPHLRNGLCYAGIMHAVLCHTGFKLNGFLKFFFVLQPKEHPYATTTCDIVDESNLDRNTLRINCDDNPKWKVIGNELLERAIDRRASLTRNITKHATVWKRVPKTHTIYQCGWANLEGRWYLCLTNGLLKGLFRIYSDGGACLVVQSNQHAQIDSPFQDELRSSKGVQRGNGAWGWTMHRMRSANILKSTKRKWAVWSDLVSWNLDMMRHNQTSPMKKIFWGKSCNYKPLLLWVFFLTCIHTMLIRRWFEQTKETKSFYHFTSTCFIIIGTSLTRFHRTLSTQVYPTISRSILFIVTR